MNKMKKKISWIGDREPHQKFNERATSWIIVEE